MPNVDDIYVSRNDDGSTKVTVSLTVERGFAGNVVLPIGSFTAVMDTELHVSADQPDETVSGAQEPAAEAATTGRRGRRSGGNTAEPAPVGAATEAAPTGRRSGRRTTAPAAAPDTTGGETAPAAAAGSAPAPSEPRRRRRAAPAEPEGISDAEVAKAASEGARVLGPETVMEILTEFDVDSTDKLPQDVREEFIKLVNDEIAEVQKKAA